MKGKTGPPPQKDREPCAPMEKDAVIRAVLPSSRTSATTAPGVRRGQPPPPATSRETSEFSGWPGRRRESVQFYAKYFLTRRS